MNFSLASTFTNMMIPRKMKSKTSATLYSHLGELWATLVIEELVRLGVVHFFVAPGSRSTPLTLAAVSHKLTHIHPHFDERGLAFMALGFAKSTGHVPAVITTSGTAVANLYPAVIEAEMTCQSLLLLTADRPVERVGVGANQSIFQVGIFGEHVNHHLNLPAPAIEYPASILLQGIDDCVLAAQSGPVHINLPFREPLYPASAKEDFEDWLLPLNSWRDDDTPFCQSGINPFLNMIENNVVSELQEAFSSHRFLVVVGTMAAQDIQQVRDDIDRFRHVFDCPVLGDVCSQLRGGEGIIRFYDGLLVNPDFHYLLSQAQVVLLFGEKIISKRLCQTLSSLDVKVCHVTPSGNRDDTLGAVRWRLRTSVHFFVDAVLKENNPSAKSDKLNKDSKQGKEMTQIQFLEQMLIWDSLSEIKIREFWPKITGNAIDINADRNINEEEVIREWTAVASYLEQLPESSTLLLANSLPVRIADTLLDHGNARILANRGASGIDGVLATAIGIAMGGNLHTGLIIGDTSFLHDVNSLAALRQIDKSMVILLLNNDGGNIFDLLPMPLSATVREDYYQMPHHLKFGSLVETFGIIYHQPITLQSLQVILNQQ